MTRVAVVDDHRVFADAVAGRLCDEPGLHVVGTASSPTEAWELLSRQSVDVLLLDLDLDGDDGLELGRAVVQRWPQTHLVVVTGTSDDSRLLEAVQIGVLGWVVKSSTTESLLSAVRGAARGETYIPAAMLTRLLISPATRGGAHDAEVDVADRLTPRELQVLRCLMAGLSRKEIATRLTVSPNTVRTHVQSILHKLEVRSALMAVALGRRAGLSPHP